ncbi:hypothetical protein [Streptomyces sp. JB150]|nr:hypothetical protein [Streptomyces sp. JB150]
MSALPLFRPVVVCRSSGRGALPYVRSVARRRGLDFWESGCAAG